MFEFFKEVNYIKIVIKKQMLNSKNIKVMQKTKKYTNSELFTLANKIRRETGCNQSEAYHKAKAQLENPKVMPVASTTPKRAGRKRNYTYVLITNKMRQHTLNKYNLSVGAKFPSVQALADYMKVSIQNIYGYVRLGVLELI